MTLTSLPSLLDHAATAGRQLSPAVADAVAADARYRGDRATLARVAALPHLGPQARAIVSADTSAAVRSVWVRRTDLTDAEREAALAGERRTTVLAAAGIPTARPPASDPGDTHLEDLLAHLPAQVAGTVEEREAAAAAVAPRVRSLLTCYRYHGNYLIEQVTAGQARSLLDALEYLDRHPARRTHASAEPAGWVMPLSRRHPHAVAAWLDSEALHPGSRRQLVTALVGPHREWLPAQDPAPALVAAVAAGVTSPDARAQLIAHAPSLVPAEWLACKVVDDALEDATVLHLLGSVSADLASSALDELAVRAAETHPSLLTGQPSPAASEWLYVAAFHAHDLIASGLNHRWLSELVRAGVLADPGFIIDMAYSRQHAAANALLLHAEALREDPDASHAWWGHLTSELLDRAGDRDVAEWARGALAGDPRLRLDLAHSDLSAERLAGILPAGRLADMPAAAVASGRGKVLARLLVDGVDQLAEAHGAESVTALLALAPTFPGTWAQLLRAAAHAA